MQIGDLVTIKPHVQPPHIYGVGLVVDRCVTDVNEKNFKKRIVKIIVRWGKLPHKVPMFFNAEAVELLSASR